MSFLKGKTAIITGAGYAVLSDGRCGSIGYGIATAYAKEGANRKTDHSVCYEFLTVAFQKLEVCIFFITVVLIGDIF